MAVTKDVCGPNVNLTHKVRYGLQKPRLSKNPSNRLIFFFPWHYISGWHLTSSMSFRHSSLDCALILQFLHPTLAPFPSNSPRHHNFGLPLLLSQIPSGLVQKTSSAGSLPSILVTCLAHLSLPRLINVTSYLSYSLYISEFLCLLQHPFSSTRPNIFSRTFI
jgi:hypothetical protein